MPDLKLHLFGPPRLELRGDIVEPDTRKATATLACMVPAANGCRADD